MTVALDDLVPGVVVHLDTDVLRAAGGSRTNAQATADEDRAVAGAHDFLVLMVDAISNEALAIPLFPRSAPGSAPLDDRQRTGPADWLAAPVYYSRWQHWRIPLGALVAASRARSSGDGGPRHYAPGTPDTLQDLANWATRNRCAYRPA
jgi:hypothetical protein